MKYYAECIKIDNFTNFAKQNYQEIDFGGVGGAAEGVGGAAEGGGRGKGGGGGRGGEGGRGGNERKQILPLYLSRL